MRPFCSPTAKPGRRTRRTSASSSRAERCCKTRADGDLAADCCLSAWVSLPQAHRSKRPQRGAMEPEARTDASGLPIRPLPDGSDVRKCTAADLTDVVEAVARSFYEDPIFRWILPDDGRRLSQLERGF